MPKVQAVSGILNGPAAENEVRSLLSACSRARLAVAYWGEGAVDRLNLSMLVDRVADVEIVCDLLSGSCNPAEIKKLIELFGRENVRAKANLHAKVWITDAGCIIGSSNASANGLGHEGDETKGLIEANISLRPVENERLSAWNEWYERNARSGSLTISKEMLLEAEEKWAVRRATRDGSPMAMRPTGSLLMQLRDNPARFRDKPFLVAVYPDTGISDEAKKGLKRAKAELLYRDLSNELDIYENWSLPSGTYVLDFTWDQGRKSAEFTGLWKVVSIEPVRELDGTSITLCTQERSFEGLTLSQRELSRAATKLMRAEGDDELTLTAEEFGCRLNRLA